jgi:hypothetical protein
MTMDTLILHRLLQAVRDSTVAASQGGFVLSILPHADRSMDVRGLFDFLEGEGALSIPLQWEGRDLPEVEVRFVELQGHRRVAPRHHLTGTIRISRNALVAIVSLVTSEGRFQTVLFGGEREPGAFQSLVDRQGDDARRHSRSRPIIAVIGGEEIPRPRGLSWEDLHAPLALRGDLRRQVEGFFDLRHHYARLGIRHRRGLLLTGPPGNGKTTALRVIASVRPEPFFLLSVRATSDQFDLDEAFDQALLDAPSVLCFEDVDSLFGDVCPLSHFLNRLDGLAPSEGILVVATTNHPEKLDAAITNRPSRFDRVYSFPNPAAAEREAYLRSLFRDDFDPRLTGWTEGLSYAQIQEVRISACLEAIESSAERPSADMARRAVERLRDQKLEIDREWSIPDTIGFRTGQVRISAGPISGRREAPPRR